MDTVCKILKKNKEIIGRFNYLAITFISIISLLLAGCGGAIKIPPYQPNTFNTYSNQFANGDLHIAIQPMTDKKEQEKYFGIVLTDGGILPVYIITENHSASRSYLLRDDNILLKNKISNDFCPKPLLSEAINDDKINAWERTIQGTPPVVGAPLDPITGNPIAQSQAQVTGQAIGAGTVVLIQAFVSIGLARKSEKVKSIQDNMFDKTFLTQSILPGKTTGGFAYFKIVEGKLDLNKSPDIMKDFLLTIQVADESEQSNKDFQFDLK